MGIKRGINGNPFAEIPTIPDAETLNRKVMKTAMKSSAGGTSQFLPPLTRIRRIEARRMEVGGKTLRDRIDKVALSFPNLDKIHPFFQETLDILFEIGLVKKALGRLYGSTSTIWQIRSLYVSKIWHATFPLEAKKARQDGLARLFSVSKRLRGALTFLEDIRSQMKCLPGIDPGQPSIVIAGYPNVGKSTLIRSVTQARPEIASYPFTTQEVNIGHFKINSIPCQIIDTPGVLDRPVEERNPIEKRALAAIRHLAWVLVFLIDPTETCGFAVKSQLKLLDEFRDMLKPIPIQIAYNKADILPLSDLDDSLVPFEDKDDLTELIAYNRDSVVEVLKKALSKVNFDREKILSLR